MTTITGRAIRAEFEGNRFELTQVERWSEHDYRQRRMGEFVEIWGHGEMPENVLSDGTLRVKWHDRGTIEYDVEWSEYEHKPTMDGTVKWSVTFFVHTMCETTYDWSTPEPRAVVEDADSVVEDAGDFELDRTTDERESKRLSEYTRK